MIAKANRLQEVKEYYFSTKLREVAGLLNEGKPIINIAIGNPDLAPSQEVLEAIKSSLSQEKAHGYQSYQGLPLLREAISKFYKKNYNVALDAATEVLPLMGSKEGIMHISMAFLNPGDEVLLPAPYWVSYSAIATLCEAKFVEIPSSIDTDFKITPAQLEAAITPKTKMIFFNSPNNLSLIHI